MSFEKSESSRREDSLIPNSQIEIMMLRVATDEQVKHYTKLCDDGHISLATAYASNIVYKLFFYLVDQWEKLGSDTEQLNREVKKTNGKRI